MKVWNSFLDTDSLQILWEKQITYVTIISMFNFGHKKRKK